MDVRQALWNWGFVVKSKGEYTSECTQASVRLVTRSWDLPSPVQWALKKNERNRIVSLAILFAAAKFFLKSPICKWWRKHFDSNLDDRLSNIYLLWFFVG